MEAKNQDDMTTKRKPFRATLASRKRLESQGYLVGDVESRIPHTFITRDLWGFADLISCRPHDKRILLVQVTGGTSSSNAHARIAKLKAEGNVGICLASGFEIWVHHWQVVRGQKERHLRQWILCATGSSIEALEV